MAEPVAAPILAVEGLQKRFGGLTALGGIDLAVGKGEVIGIIGANGAGKTTFVNIVTGYLKPSDGRITVNGIDVTGLPPRVMTRRGICRSFQMSQLFASLTCLENLVLAHAAAENGGWKLLADPWTADRLARAEEGLARFGIADYRDARTATLPQGVRKLLDVVLAVAARPHLLLLDEPTSGIASDQRFQIMDVIMGQMAECGVTVLFVEHDMDLVERYARRVLAFLDGRIAADGSVAEVFGHDEVRRAIVGDHRATRRPMGPGQ